MLEQNDRKYACFRLRFGANDSRTLVREWLYNRRSQLASAQVGANAYGYTYDTIGNRLMSTDGNETKRERRHQVCKVIDVATVPHGRENKGAVYKPGVFLFCADASFLV